MPLPQRRFDASARQPALPLDVGAAGPARERTRRPRPRPREEEPVQLTLAMPLEAGEDSEDLPGTEEPPPDSLSASDSPISAEAGSQPERPAEPGQGSELPELEPEPPGFEPDPFAEIPGFTPAPPAAGEFVLLPGSLRGRLDLREFARFMAGLRTVVRDWEGAPEIDDGGVRLRGPAGGAWVYPEAQRVRLVTDGAGGGPVGEDLVALCRWLEARAGMRLYPAGSDNGAAPGADRSLDPWETFLGG